jgi:hypothetical protein
MVSFLILQYPTVIGVCGIMWIVMMFVLHQVIDTMNVILSVFPLVITEQTIASAQFGLSVATYSPGFILLTLALWAVVKSNVGGDDF